MGKDTRNKNLIKYLTQQVAENKHLLLDLDSTKDKIIKLEKVLNTKAKVSEEDRKEDIKASKKILNDLKRDLIS